jgi:hypothetical protein
LLDSLKGAFVRELNASGYPLHLPQAIWANVLRVFAPRSRRKNLVEQTLTPGFAPLWKINRFIY